MQLQLDTDATIRGDERLTGIAHDIVTSAPGHPADANAAKGGWDDTPCTVEARPEGPPPPVTTPSDADAGAALRGAARKTRAAPGSRFGKRSRH